MVRGGDPDARSACSSKRMVAESCLADEDDRHVDSLPTRVFVVLVEVGEEPLREVGRLQSADLYLPVSRMYSTGSRSIFTCVDGMRR